MIFYNNVNSIADLFSVSNVMIAILLALFNAIFLLPLARKYLQIVQQSSYSNGEFYQWFLRKGNVFPSRLMMTALLSVLSYVLFTITFSFANAQWISYLAFVFYAFFVALYIYGDYRHKDKCQLNLTKRMKRFVLCYFVLCFIASILAVLLINLIFFPIKGITLLVKCRFALLCCFTMLVPHLVTLANFVCSPIEKKINAKFIEKCKKRLQENPSLIKIGITGSYAKTTVKSMLATMLSVKYKVLATPLSYNTPMGICKASEPLDSSYDVFIAEMGARHKGDVKELCDIVKPDFGVLTGITEQHLDTFKTLENIIETKSELLTYLNGKTLAVTSDNANSLKATEKFKNVKIIKAGFSDENALAFPQEVEMGTFGSRFTLNLDGKKIKVSTSLLGEHNISNICLSASLCYELGLKIEEIALGISRIVCPPHRLEVVPNSNGIIVIDDGYNSNVEGTKASLKVLSSFQGRKIVVTPGLVELGLKQAKLNEEFGERLSSVCEHVVLVGSGSAYHVRTGLLNKGFKFDNIHNVKTLDDAKKLLKSITLNGDVVLFENDLPDRFD